MTGTFKVEENLRDNAYFWAFNLMILFFMLLWPMGSRRAICKPRTFDCITVTNVCSHSVSAVYTSLGKYRDSKESKDEFSLKQIIPKGAYISWILHLTTGVQNPHFSFFTGIGINIELLKWHTQDLKVKCSHSFFDNNLEFEHKTVCASLNIWATRRGKISIKFSLTWRNKTYVAFQTASVFSPLREGLNLKQELGSNVMDPFTIK